MEIQLMQMNLEFRTKLWIMVATFLFMGALVQEVRAQDTSTVKSATTNLTNAVQFYALLVGSNLPGKSQLPLRYAHQDVEKVREVLINLGKYSPENIQQLTDPSADTLYDALQDIRAQIAQHSPTTQTRFVFYYSGHAKSRGLTLGEDVFSLEVLRKLLLDIPSSQNIIVLDACQSGSFSRVKGVGVSEDFSHNSRAMLQTTGMAVLASSSARELSQESDELEGSIFTHNLLTGLRGAADVDANGRVSLHEAYDYAYNNTLVASAETKVGHQHVTLETDFKGTGETVLTWPEEANAKLMLPKGLSGTVVIYDTKSKSIHAEIHKAQGSDVVLGFPPGRYGVMVTKSQKVMDCSIALKDATVTQLKTNRCDTRTFSADSGRAKRPEKKNDSVSDPYRWRPFVSLQGGLMYHYRGEAYLIRNISEFSKHEVEDGFNLYGELNVGMAVNRYFALAVVYSSLKLLDFIGQTQDEQTGEPYKTNSTIYKYFGHRLNAQLRLSYPVLNRKLTPHLFVDGGLGLVHDVYTPGEYEKSLNPGPVDKRRTYKLPVIGGGVGISIRLYKMLQLLIQTKYIYASGLKDNLGKKDLGGLALAVGLHVGQ